MSRIRQEQKYVNGSMNYDVIFGPKRRSEATRFERKHRKAQALISQEIAVQVQQDREKFLEKERGEDRRAETYQVDGLLEDGLEVSLLVSHGGAFPPGGSPSLVFLSLARAVRLPDLYAANRKAESLLVNAAFHLVRDGLG